jgi:hypothetical protein
MMSRDKILLTLMLTAVVAIVGSFVYAAAFRERPPYDDDTCNALAAVASDPQKVEYVREWMVGRMKDAEFMVAAERLPYFEQRNPLEWPYVHLDARRLGFAPTLVQFNGDDGEDVRANGLRYAQIHAGRPSIIIQLDPADDLGPEWSAKDREQLRVFSPGAFVLCDYSD